MIKFYFFAILIIISGLFLVKYTDLTSYTTKSNSQSKNVDAEQMEPKKHEQGIKEAIKWLRERRLNDVTGEVEIEDYLIAMKKVNQQISRKTNSSGNIQWIELGPDNIGGRTRSILVDRLNNSKLYAGAVSGGLFVSDNAGVSWNRVPLLNADCENEETLNVGCIAQGPNGNIYVGTGEFVGTDYPGNGIYKSTDGGVTFCQIPSTSTSYPNPNQNWSYVNKIVVDPTNEKVIYAATYGGLKVTNDGGNSWEKANGTSAGQGYDLEISSDGQYIHAVIGLQYWRSTNGGLEFEKRNGINGFPNSGFNRLVIALAPTDDNYVYAYGSTGSGLYGIFQSKDKGENWINIGNGGSSAFNPPGQQGYYDLEIAVMPQYPERVYIGGQMAIWSWSPTKGWNTISGWGFNYVHPDHHVITFDWTNPNIMYIGCDGGIYKSLNAKEDYPSFRQSNKNFITTQFYNMAASEATGEVIGGTQDNGSPHVSFLGNTYRSSTGNITGGDGFGCEISKLNPSVFFGSLYYGRVVRSTNSGKGTSGFFDTHIDSDGDSSPDDGASFYTTIALWEGVDDTLNEMRINGEIDYYDSLITDMSFTYDTTLVYDDTVFGTDTIHYIADSIITVDTVITTNLETFAYYYFDTTYIYANTKSNRLFLATYGAIWMADNPVFSPNPVWYKVAQIPYNRSCTAMDFSKDGNYLYVAASTNLYRISGLRNDNFGYYHNCKIVEKIIVDNNNNPTDTIKAVDCDYIPTVNNVSVKAIYSSSSTITDISVDPNNNDHIVVSLGGYGTSSKIFESNNATSGTPAFTSLQGALPNMPVYSVLIDRYDTNIVYAGTEFGFYVLSGGVWNHEISGMQQVPVLEIRQQKHPSGLIDANDKDSLILYIGTYGRGIFVSGFEPGKITGTNRFSEKELFASSIDVYPNPASNFVNIEIDIFSQEDVFCNFYDIEGKLIQRNIFPKQKQGNNHFRIDISTFNTGTYFIRLKAGNLTGVGKLMVLR